MEKSFEPTAISPYSTVYSEADRTKYAERNRKAERRAQNRTADCTAHYSEAGSEQCTKHGETLSIELAGSSANANTLGFVRVDVDAATGARSVAGVAYGDTAAFTEAVRGHMDGGFQQAAHGGDFAATATWTVAGATGYYAPVLITPSGQVFVIGNANPGGHDQIRVYGENTFGFEDLAYNQGSDFDYNDMVMRLKPTPDHPFS